MPSRSFTAVQSAPVVGFQAMPTGLRKPDASTRLPPPSGLYSMIDALGGPSALTFDAEPIDTYIFDPSRQKITPRVEWPPGGKGVTCCGGPCAAVWPRAYAQRTTAFSLPT